MTVEGYLWSGVGALDSHSSHAVTLKAFFALVLVVKTVTVAND